MCYGSTMIGRPAEDTPAPEAELPSEEARVLLWRTETLVKAGYNDLQAEILARARHVDLHAAVSMVESGCSHQHAAMILL
jgi:hypothetical protein